jgi:hypothetical protein
MGPAAGTHRGTLSSPVGISFLEDLEEGEECQGIISYTVVSRRKEIGANSGGR